MLICGWIGAFFTQMLHKVDDYTDQGEQGYSTSSTAPITTATVID